ncbi:MAG: PspC domain-containing protein [Bacteroidetes bacterium]|nr:PspC domain-containing protein [Bacteroidota bacterium]
MNKLYRNTQEGKLLGVCAGIADHFKVDALLVRVLFLTSFFCLGIGLLPYLLVAILAPKKPL